MSDKNIKIIISATAAGVKEAVSQSSSAIKSGFRQGKEEVKAFNASVGTGQKALASMTSAIKAMLVGVVGFQVLKNAVRIMQDAQQAAFNMSNSVAAANREFKNAGSVQEWEDTIKSLSGELKIYSDTALRGAVSRTIDMTKRLGLSKDQMVEVIKRSADLGAGKVELEGAIERVTAALRGEAQSAEFLGLTLNDTYVKAVYEADNANKQSWESLTALEKAQARYNAFLQQSEQFTGRAAASSKTFSGALRVIRKELENSVANSKDFEAALGQVALVLKENSGEIGAVIAKLLTFAAKTIEMVIKWKGLLLTLAGTTVAIMVITKLVSVVTGLVKIFKILKELQIGAFLGGLKTSLEAAATQATLTGKAMSLGFAAAIGYAIGSIARLIPGVDEAAQAFAAWTDRLLNWTGTQERANVVIKEAWEKVKDFKLPGDITKAAQADLEQFRTNLAGARAYYMALRTQLEQKSKETGIFGAVTLETMAAQHEMKNVDARLKEIQADFVKLGGTAAEEMKKPAVEIKASIEQLDAFSKAAQAAYDDAKKAAADYAQQVIEWEEKIKYAKLSTADKIRELGQKGMTEAQTWADNRLRAEEKFYAAKQALVAGDYELAEKLAKEAEALYADLATEVKDMKGGNEVVVKALEDTKKIAIEGVTAIGTFIQELYAKQQAAATTMQAEWAAAAEGIKAHLDEITRQREAKIDITLNGLEAAQVAINNLTKDETKHITVVVHEKSSSSGSSASGSMVEAHRHGGIAGAIRAAAGKILPGYGGGDKIDAILEAGEGVLRKEVIAGLGKPFFHAYNRGDISTMLKVLLNKKMSSISIPQIMMPGMAGRMAFAGGGIAPGISTGNETFTIRLQAGSVEMPITAVGNKQTMRGMVKDFEKELIKMGQSRR